MGEIADMILDGLLDEETGEYIGDDNGNGYGYPTSARKQQDLHEELTGKSKPKNQKFNPTKENLAELSKSLTVTHLEQLIEMVLKRTSHEWCTRHTFSVTADGCESSIVTTGPEFIKAHGGNYKNLRGEKIK